MKKKSFLIWMLGWPLVSSICDFLTHTWCHKEYSVGVNAMTGVIMILTWSVIGILLWKDDNKKSDNYR